MSTYSCQHVIPTLASVVISVMSSCIEIMFQSGRDNSFSSSLDGMERSLPRAACIESIIELYEDDSLHSETGISPRPSVAFTPSTRSSVYELSEDYAPASPTFCTREELFGSEFSRELSKRTSSIVRVPNAFRPRPRLARGVTFHTDTLEKRTRPKEPDEDGSRASRSAHQDEDVISRSTSSIRASEPQDRELQECKHQEKQKAKDHQPVLDTASQKKSVVDLIPHYTGLEDSPSRMSPNISHSEYSALVPDTVRVSTGEESRHSSHFSSSSSEGECLSDAPKRSRARARKRLQKYLSPVGTKELFSPASHTPSKDLQTQSGQSPLGGPHRGSVQQSITDMYDTLQSLYSPPAGSLPKPRQDYFTTPPPKTKCVPREIRSPAIPMTPYQKYGRKAWEESKSLPRRTTLFRRSPRPSEPSSPISLPPETSLKKTGSPNRTLARISSRFSLSSRSTSKDPKVPRLSNKENERVTRYSSPASPDYESKRRRSATSNRAPRFHSGSAEMENAAWGRVEEVRKTSEEMRKEELKKRIVVMVPLF